MEIKVAEVNKDLLEQCLVGRLNDISMFDKIQKVLVLEDMKEVKLKYLGDDLVLIIWMDEGKA